MYTLLTFIDRYIRSLKESNRSYMGGGILCCISTLFLSVYWRVHFNSSGKST